MYYMCPFNDKYLIGYIELDTNCDALKAALRHFDEGNLEEGHAICNKLSRETSLALVLSSMFSRKEETESDFEERHIHELEQASNKGNSLAQYSIAVYLEQGDLILENKIKAREYYQRSAEAGDKLAKNIFGIMLYYGTGGVDQDRNQGLSYLKSSASSGVEDAKIFLDSIG